jgi:hypothetical protein
MVWSWLVGYVTDSCIVFTSVIKMNQSVILCAGCSWYLLKKYPDLKFDRALRHSEV